MLKININKTYFAVILFLLASISIFEIHYLLYLITVIIYYSKISKKLFELVTFLIVIVFIAVISSVFNKDFVFYNWIKDLAYFSKPILAILAGYFIAKKVNNFITIFKIIIYLSFLFAIIHLSKIFIFVDFSTASVSKIRYIGGLSNEILVLAIVILLASKKLINVEIIENKLYKKIVLFVFGLSFLLYFSRTMILSFTILYLASLGYLKLTRKSLKYLFLVVTIFGLFYAYLYSRSFEREKPGIESFLYKIKIAPAEIFVPAKNFDPKNHADLWDHWRAYEAKMAITQMNSSLNFFIGKGLGSLVDLKFKAPLSEKGMRYIPILHNGFINIFYKAGIIGLLMFLVFLLSLYLYGFSKTKNDKKILFLNITTGLAVRFLFTTLVVTGMYNITEIMTFVLGVFMLFIKSEEKKLLPE